MKNFFSSFTLFVLLLPATSYASHEAGLDLRYQHLVDSTYRVYFTFYRDCSGIPVSSSYNFRATSTCGVYINFLVSFDSTVEINHLCASNFSRCDSASSPYIGFEANYFHGDVTLPDSCNEWTFNLQSAICNRNAMITNLLAGGSVWCAFVEARLIDTDVYPNSSPVFKALPKMILCNNHIQSLDVNAEDADGDSLVFELYTPHSDAITDVDYINGLSGTQPVSFAIPADSTRINSSTGKVQFKADGVQITVVGVRVNEFRNGIFIGSTERDMQIIFQTPTSIPAIVTNTVFTSHICVDSLLTRQINTSDADNDSVYFWWNNNISGSQIEYNVDSQSAVFSWQPQASDIRSNPYTFTIYATDSICPNVYVNSYDFIIYVDSCFISPAASFTSPQEVCAGSCIDFTNFSTNASSYQWYFPGSTQDTSTLSDPPAICYSIPGNYDVQLIAGNSSGSDTLFLQNYITVYPIPLAQTITQSGDTLFAIQGVLNYQWYYNNNLIPGATDYFYVAQASGDYMLIATNSDGCEVVAEVSNVLAEIHLPVGNGQLAIFPNPLTDKLFLIGYPLLGTVAEIFVYNLMGEKISLDIDRELLTVNCKPLKPGIYFLEVVSDKKYFRSKFVKQ
jgi:PKD repeat protein